MKILRYSDHSHSIYNTDIRWPLPRTQTSLSMCAQRKAGRRQLPMVPCGSSPVTRFALASAMRKTKRLRRRLRWPSLLLCKLSLESPRKQLKYGQMKIGLLYTGGVIPRTKKGMSHSVFSSWYHSASAECENESLPKTTSTQRALT